VVAPAWKRRFDEGELIAGFRRAVIWSVVRLP
jgi:hypothetical protein